MRIILCLVAFCIAVSSNGSSLSFGEEPKPPPISERGKDGKDHVLEDDKLLGYEQEWRAKFTKPDAPDEIFLLSWSFSSIILDYPPKVTNPRALVIVETRGKSGTVRLISDFGKKKTEQELSADQVRKFQDAVAKAKADQLSRLDSSRVVEGKEIVVASGSVYVYLHITAKKGHRVWMNNPPGSDDIKAWCWN